MYFLNSILSNLKFIKYIYYILKLNKLKLGTGIINHYNIFVEQRKQIKLKTSPVDLSLPWISFLALEYIDAFIKKYPKKSLNIFEYGSGGSTLYFSDKVGSLHSVEHDLSWYKYIIKKIKLNDKFIVQLVEPEVNNDISANRSPSVPTDYYSSLDLFKTCNFESYVKSIENFENNYFDIILIDGRSRVSCILHAINKLKKGGILILDNAERERYFESNLIKNDEFRLELDHYGALIGSPGFVKTNIYRKI